MVVTPFDAQRFFSAGEIRTTKVAVLFYFLKLVNNPDYPSVSNPVQAPQLGRSAGCWIFPGGYCVGER